MKLLYTLAGALLLIALRVVLFPALQFAMLPRINLDKFGIVALLLFLLILIIGRRGIWQAPRWAIWPLAALAVVSFPLVVIAHGFGSVDVMALLFHLEFGIEGAGFEELHNEMLAAALALIWLVFATWVISTLAGRKLWPYMLSILVLLASNPLMIYAAQKARAHVTQSDLAERLTLAPAWKGTAPSHDVIMLYLEGLDEAYFTDPRFAEAIAPVAALKKEAINLTAVRQIEATGWSMAGVVASHCGVPLLPNGFRARNNFDEVDDFLGAHRCLGDVMKEAGYQLEFIMGGDLAFAGYGRFLSQHGFETSLGLKHFKENYPKRVINAARINWVLDDQILYAEALKRQAALVTSERPYGLVVETITTHGDTAYASRECMPKGKAGQTRDLPPVVQCFAKQTAAFVEAVMAQQQGRPLKLIILSDHLSHSKQQKEVLTLETRANTVMLIDSESHGQEIRKEGSMIDIYPTLLDWLELAPDTGETRGGLGVSLFSERPTLVEEKGLLPLNAELYLNLELSRAIWQDGP